MRKTICAITCVVAMLLCSSTAFAAPVIGDIGLWFSKYRVIPLYNDINGTSHKTMNLNDQFFSSTKTAIKSKYEEWLNGYVLSGAQAGQTGYSLKRNLSRSMTTP